MTRNRYGDLCYDDNPGTAVLVAGGTWVYDLGYGRLLGLTDQGAELRETKDCVRFTDPPFQAL